MRPTGAGLPPAARELRVEGQLVNKELPINHAEGEGSQWKRPFEVAGLYALPKLPNGSGSAKLWGATKATLGRTADCSFNSRPPPHDNSVDPFCLSVCLETRKRDPHVDSSCFSFPASSWIARHGNVGRAGGVGFPGRMEHHRRHATSRSIDQVVQHM